MGDSGLHNQTRGHIVDIKSALEFFSSASPNASFAFLLFVGAGMFVLGLRYVSRHEDITLTQVAMANEHVENAQGVTKQLIEVYGELSGTLRQVSSAMQNVAAVLAVVRNEQETFYATSAETLAVIKSSVDGVPDEVEKKLQPQFNGIRQEIRALVEAFNTQIEAVFDKTGEQIALITSAVAQCHNDVTVEISAPSDDTQTIT